MFSRLTTIVTVNKLRRQAALGVVNLRRFKKKDVQSRIIDPMNTDGDDAGNEESSLPSSDYKACLQVLKTMNTTTTPGATKFQKNQIAECAHQNNMNNPNTADTPECKIREKALSLIPEPRAMKTIKDEAIELLDAPPEATDYNFYPASHRKIRVYTDASSTYGAGGHCGQFWFCYQWPDHIKSQQKLKMGWMELFPITVAARLFGKDWYGEEVTFYTDNEEVVNGWNGKRHWKLHEMISVEALKSSSFQFQFKIAIAHIKSNDNTLADSISRGKAWLPNFKAIDIPDGIVQDLLHIEEDDPNNWPLIYEIYDFLFRKQPIVGMFIMLTILKFITRIILWKLYRNKDNKKSADK